MQQPTLHAPVGAEQRIATLDILRGFALFGILLGNLRFFSQPSVDTFDYAASGSPADLLIGWVIVWFAQGKFYPLFSLLFGLGFALQLQRAEARGGSGSPLYFRRLLVLALIGIAHGTLIWSGDILITYALLGFLLLAIGRGSAQRLLRFALIALTVEATWLSAVTLLTGWPNVLPELSAWVVGRFRDAGTGTELLRETAWAVYTGGSYAESVVVRAREVVSMLAGLPFWGIQILGMFLFGAWLGRRGVLARPEAHARLLHRGLLLGFGLGLPLAAWYAAVDLAPAPTDPANVQHGLRSLLNLASGPLLMFGYVAAITLALRRPGGRWLHVFAPVGRMALSNYLLQSVVMTLVFNGYGFGMMAERPGAPFMLAVALPLYLAQVLASHAWLRNFRFGPAEWLWRSLTYGKWQPLRVVDGMAPALRAER